MYCSNGSSSMATLLQQKNCMKTLTNGGVAGGSSSSSSASASTVATTGLLSTTPTTTTTITGTVGVSGVGAINSGIITTGGQTSQNRLMLPHEMVAIPINAMSNSNGSSINGLTHTSTQSPFGGGGGSGGSNNSFMNHHQTDRKHQPYHQQHHHHHHQQQHHSQSLQHNQFHSMGFYSNNIHHTNHNATSATGVLPHTLPHHQTTSSSSSSLLSISNSNKLSSPFNHNSPDSTTELSTKSSTTNTTTGGTTNISSQQIKQEHSVLNIDHHNQNQHHQHQQQQQHHHQHHNHDETSLSPVADAATTANTEQQQQLMIDDEDQEPEPEIDIVINNVVCSFSVRSHLNLREIALNGTNVEFRRENGMVTMKLRRPYTTASIWSSGRITCTGATSEDQAKIAARRYARCLQKLGFNVKFNHFRVVNVLGTCSMPWAIKIVNFSEKYKKEASYEPELHPGVTYKLKYPKATLKIFSTGSITVTASSVANVQAAIEHIFPLVYEFRKKRAFDDPKLLKEKAAQEALIAAATAAAIEQPDAISLGEPPELTRKIKKIKTKHPFGHASNDPTEDMMFVSDGEDNCDGGGGGGGGGGGAGVGNSAVVGGSSSNNQNNLGTGAVGRNCPPIGCSDDDDITGDFDDDDDDL